MPGRRQEKTTPGIVDRVKVIKPVVAIGLGAVMALRPAKRNSLRPLRVEVVTMHVTTFVLS
ncbi:hypothetical protein GCM10027176_02910 [Actinoallomurus bryophytorum]